MPSAVQFQTSGILGKNKAWTTEHFYWQVLRVQLSVKCQNVILIFFYSLFGFLKIINQINGILLLRISLCMFFCSLKVKEAAHNVDTQLVVVACGSYRREKSTCGDVDILITHPDGESHKGVFSKVLHLLHQSGMLLS